MFFAIFWQSDQSTRAKCEVKRTKNVLHFAIKCSNFFGFWGSVPDPAGGAYDAPPDPLIVRGFLPSAIETSRVPRSYSRIFHPIGYSNRGPILVAVINIYMAIHVYNTIYIYMYMYCH